MHGRLSLQPLRFSEPELPFVDGRREFGVVYTSWKDAHGVPQFRRVWEHCVDFNWPWWRGVALEE